MGSNSTRGPGRQKGFKANGEVLRLRKKSLLCSGQHETRVLLG